MDNQYKPVKFKLSSWKMLRRAFYGRQNETFSDYIERIADKIKPKLNEMPEPCGECAGCERGSGCNMQSAWMLKNEQRK